MSEVIVTVVLAALLSIFVYFVKTGVPPVPATRREIAAAVALLRESGIKPSSKIYELGCGWASMTLGLSRAFPQASIVGLEISPLPYLVAKLRTLRNPRIIITRRDFLAQSFEDADAITAYLGIKSIAELAPRLDLTVRPQTPVVALCFLFRDRQPTNVVSLRTLGSEAALYRWPARR
jgi:precorrin-6B methylase 2